ncbi:MAG: MBL fold metallo-hydrolase, partial [Peptococcaceae bacterium]|nr:MBL fold metallo-hydrolase [Peptococcaceae bacterium]
GRLSGGKPLTVVNTHFHADHTLGNSAFEAVYISFLDAPLLRAFQYEERWNEFVGKAVDRSFFDDTDRIPFRPYEIREIANHQIFDLGGCEIEAILMPGHSPGGMCFLDRRDRVLFSGDALMDPFPTSFRAALRPETPGREYATVAAFRRELANLVTRADEFDCLCDGHGVPNSDTRRVSDMLECAESVVQAPDSGFDLRETARGAVKSKRYGIAAIDYRDDRVS